jgi:hypothetical protein
MSDAVAALLLCDPVINRTREAVVGVPPNGSQ